MHSKMFVLLCPKRIRAKSKWKRKKDAKKRGGRWYWDCYNFQGGTVRRSQPAGHPALFWLFPLNAYPLKWYLNDFLLISSNIDK